MASDRGKVAGLYGTHPVEVLEYFGKFIQNVDEIMVLAVCKDGAIRYRRTRVSNENLALCAKIVDLDVTHQLESTMQSGDPHEVD